MLKIFGTHFGQSQTDLGLKMVPVFFTCVLYCGFGCCWAENGHGFRFQRSGTEVEKGGGGGGAVYGQSTYYF